MSSSSNDVALEYQLIRAKDENEMLKIDLQNAVSKIEGYKQQHHAAMNFVAAIVKSSKKQELRIPKVKLLDIGINNEIEYFEDFQKNDVIIRLKEEKSL